MRCGELGDRGVDRRLECALVVEGVHHPGRVDTRVLDTRVEVVGIFPDRTSVIHLDGRAVPVEQHDEGTEGHRYLCLELLAKARLTRRDGR